MGPQHREPQSRRDVTEMALPVPGPQELSSEEAWQAPPLAVTWESPPVTDHLDLGLRCP